MKILKTLATVLAADLLSLFIGLTLAVSSGMVARIISAVCTSGILICVLGSFASKTAEEDEKKPSSVMPLLMGFSASIPALLSWLILKFSDIDFYRWHKLVNGYFLQIFNFINSDASSAALTESQIWLMLPLSFAPTAIFLISYYLKLKK